MGLFPGGTAQTPFDLECIRVDLFCRMRGGASSRAALLRARPHAGECVITITHTDAAGSRNASHGAPFVREPAHSRMRPTDVGAWFSSGNEGDP